MKGIKDIIVKGSIFAVLSAVFCMGGLFHPLFTFTALAATVWSEDQTFNEKTTINGDIKLTNDIILTVANGKTLTINGSIDCNNNTLTIEGPGTVSADGVDQYCGIERGTVILNGGTLNATGGIEGDGINGNVIINGGTLNATGGEYEDGIDSITFGDNWSVTINGGTLNATGGEKGGCGIYGDVEQNGGELTAIGGESDQENGGDGIQGSVTIYSGTLTTTGGEGEDNGGRGICGKVIQEGGTLTATGGKSDENGGTGIDSTGDEGWSVTVNGGTLGANGGKGHVNGGSGIYSSFVYMNGGTLIANGGEANGNEYGNGGSGVCSTVELNDGTLTATGGKANEDDSGEGGRGIVGSVTQYGGTLKANGGEGSYFGGAGIGGDVTLNDGTQVVNGGTGLQENGGIGIIGSNITIAGGTLTVRGGDGTSSGGFGIYGNVSLEGGSLTVTGGAGNYTEGGYGILGDVTLTSGTLKVSGGACYLCDNPGAAFGGIVTITDGKFFTIDGTQSFSGTLTDDQKEAVARKFLTSCPAVIGESYYDTIQEAMDAATAENYTVKLLRDVETDSMLTVSKNLILDLNGHTIEPRRDIFDNFSVISIRQNKNLTLSDNSIAGTGLITGGRGGSSCGGVNVGDGTFTMTGGTISGNSSGGNGGGVYVRNGAFTMTGGTICDNIAGSTGNGGGVYVRNGTFTMTGGTICNNKTGEGNGGGVYVGNGTFELFGGTIKNNEKSEDANNVYLPDGKTITISGVLSETTSIGFLTESKPTGGSPVEITSRWNTYMNGVDPSPYFIYDDPSYALALDENGEVELRRGYAVTVKNGTGSRSYFAGATVTIKADAPPAGKVFDKWTTEDGVEFANAASETTTFTMSANAVTVEATYKDMEKVKAPAFTPDGGTYTSAQSVIISSETSGADIYYTIDGSTPTKDGGKKYSEPVSVTKTTTIKAIAVNADIADSDVSSATYMINSVTPATTYAVTVENGDGDGNYAAGVTVTIKADAPADGKVFDRWTGDGVTFANAASETTTFTMPAKAVTVKATYRDMNTVAAPGFTPDVGNYTSEQSVTISCSTEGAVIYYTVDGTDPTKASAKYSEPIPVKEDMTIKAFAVKDGMTDSAVSEAKYTIGEEPVTTKYRVTVNSGTGDGEYSENATVTIKADDPADGKVFDKWTTEDGVEFADAASPETTFRMPSHDVTVTATYKDKEQKKEDDPDPNKPEPDKTKVPVTDPASSYASADDNFAPVAPGASEGTGGNIKKLELDFSNVKGSGVAPDGLKMTAIAGSKFTTKAKVKDKDSVKTEGGVKAKFNKKDSTATITCKTDGKATFETEDGSYTVNFKVDKPKPNKNEAKLSTGTAPVTKTVKDLFGTSINGGKLTILKEKVSGQAAVKDNELTVNPAEKDTIKLQYQYLNKKYKLTMKVK